MVCETYPCYVRITGSADEDEVELPTEENGTMLLSTVTAQFPNAIGLRFKSESGAWRGVRVTDGVLDAPIEGWGDTDYYITVAKAAEKRKLDTDDGPKSKKEVAQDLIVLGLPYTSTEDDLRDHFEKYGELAHWEIKTDRETGKSKGFGFVRYTDADNVDTVLAASHTMGGRNLEVRYPKRDNNQQQQHDGVPTKLFIGRLPRGARVEDLRDCFSEFGPLKDVYIPQNFRGFGFVTFASQAAANAALNTTHIVKGNTLNVTFPSPKAGDTNPQNMQMQQPQYGYGNMQGNMQPMQGNMQGGMQGMQGGMQGMQGGMQGMQGGMQGMQGNMQPMQQQGGWYGNQQKNTGYYSNAYQQPAAKVNGK